MTPEIVARYFLKAGASFRRSDAWRKLHETDEGKSRVLRSGRFGVGVLAAFLLGDEIEVSTRHVTAAADEGLTFKATVDTEEIELTRCGRPVGTTIKVRIQDSSIFASLAGIKGSSHLAFDTATGTYRESGEKSWDWYCLSDPAVIRIFSGRKQRQQFSLTEENATLPANWHRIRNDDYRDIQWSYQDAPVLTANGIVVIKTHHQYSPKGIGHTGNFSLLYPKVSVFDPDGNLPLVLQRTALATEKYPFDEQLFDDIIRDLVAYILVYAPDRPLSETGDISSFDKWYPGIPGRSREDSTSTMLFCCAENGIYPSDSWNIRQGNFHKILISDNWSPLPTGGPQEPQTLLIPIRKTWGIQRHRSWNRFALGGANEFAFGYLRDFKPICRRMLLSKREFDTICRGGIIASCFWDPVVKESSNDDWVVVRNGECECGKQFDLLAFAAAIKDPGLEPIVIEWHLAESQPDLKDISPLARAWQQKLPLPFVPFDHAERRKIFSGAFAEMNDYVVAHELNFVEEEKKKQSANPT